MLLSLPEKAISNILTFLSFDELLKLRRVSKQAKKFVDEELKNTKIEIVVERKDKCIEKFHYLASAFPNAEAIALRQPQIPIETLFDVFAGKFPQLESIEVNGKCRNISKDNLHLIGEYFPSIRKLSINRQTLSDSTLEQLFSLCPLLEVLHLVHCKGLNGNYLAHFGDNLTEFKSVACDLKRNPLSLTTNGKGINITKLHYVCFTDDEFEIQRMLATEMTNVTKLHLWFKELYHFGDFSLNNLEELTLYADTINGSMKVNEPCLLTKKVEINFRCTSSQMAAFLSNFPNVEKLHLNITGIRRSSIKIIVDEMVMQEIISLRSLKVFILEDRECHTETYICNDGRNAIIVIISQMPWIQLFELCLYNDEDFNGHQFVNELNKIAIKRPWCTFKVSVQLDDGVLTYVDLPHLDE